MLLQWRKCILQSRCRLNSLNLNNEHFDSLIGVSVIYSGDNRISVVSINQGNIRDILTELKNDKNIQRYEPDLFVTWSAVPNLSLDGVVSYLCKKLNPIIQNTFSQAESIPVNLP